MTSAAYFNPPAWPPELVQLQSAIGLGRCAPLGEDVSLWLSLRRHCADGSARPLLPIELVLEGCTVYAWIEEGAFVEWLEPVLPVPNIAALAVEMRCAACAWTLAPWLRWCAQHALSIPSLKALGEATVLPAPISEPACAVLTLATDDEKVGSKRLDLMLTGFPYEWLNILACRMDACPEPRAQACWVDVIGSAGFAQIPVEQLSALRSGDVVFAARQAPMSEGRLFCHIGSLFFQARRMDHNRFEVERIMTSLDEEFDKTSDAAQCIPESTVADLPITLIFEIGRMPVSLTQLAQLQVGEVLETELEFAPDVGIRAQGKLIASAKLVRVGGRLGAQITQMMHSEPKRPVKRKRRSKQSAAESVDFSNAHHPDNTLEPDRTDPLQ